MYKPKFPYLGNQAIITSGRVVHHSYDDFIFLFGNKGVAISSPATFTVDATERTIIASPKIELGYQAETKGEPVMLGRSTARELGRLCGDIIALSNALENISAENLSTSFSGIVKNAKLLKDTAASVSGSLAGPVCLSANTFTK